MEEEGEGEEGGRGEESTDHFRVALLGVDWVDVWASWGFWEASSLECSRGGSDGGGEQPGSQRPGEGQSSGKHLCSVPMLRERGGMASDCADGPTLVTIEWGVRDLSDGQSLREHGGVFAVSR